MPFGMVNCAQGVEQVPVCENRLSDSDTCHGVKECVPTRFMFTDRLFDVMSRCPRDAMEQAWVWWKSVGQ
jgi:hypothetical protein